MKKLLYMDQVGCPQGKMKDSAETTDAMLLNIFNEGTCEI